MALVNHAKREINAKIVLCGAEGSGKATLLQAICAQLPERNRGQLRSMALQQDRMLFFDFTHPDGGDVEKYALRLHIYTLTGPVTQEAAWKMVMKGADGVVFVADSGVARRTANQQAFDGLVSALQANGKQLADVPAIVICSKQDLPGALSPDQVRSSLSLPAIPLFITDNSSGPSVLAPLCEILESVLSVLGGLGLDLQSAALELCRLAPERTTALLPSEPPPPGPGPSGSTESVEPVLTLDGVPELSRDGVLTVAIRVDCCGRSSLSRLNISISPAD